jgi:hypothetical protein
MEKLSFKQRLIVVGIATVMGLLVVGVHYSTNH